MNIQDAVEQLEEDDDIALLGIMSLGCLRWAASMVRRKIQDRHYHMKSFQHRVDDWVVACFGGVKEDSRKERCYRFFEEAAELVQAGGMTHQECLELVNYMFSRPVGDIRQEVGGAMTTLAALCTTFEIDMDECGEQELARIYTRIPEIRRKDATKPHKSPLPGTPEVADEDVCGRCGQTYGPGGCDGYCDCPD